MIRVLIAEDEPPIRRRTQRMIEKIDPDFCVAALAGDGEEALEKLHAEHFDVLFTDIRMPVMDGMQLMKHVQHQYPDCSIVVLSGYQDFEYVSTAIRAQAVDYLLKPVAEDTLEKLLFTLKERFIARKQERMQQSVAARLHHMLPDAPPDGLQAVQLGICLFCAGPMPQTMDTSQDESAPDVWQSVSLTAATKALCPGSVLFVQEFMGSSPAERILVYQLEENCTADFSKTLYEMVCENSKLPVSCLCLSDTAALSAIGTVHKRLRRMLAQRIVIGQNDYASIDTKTLLAANPAPDDFTGDADAAAQYASGLTVQSPHAAAAAREELLKRITQERWTQQRTVHFFRRVMALLEANSAEPGGVLPKRAWFDSAISTAVSLTELKEIIKSLESASPAADEGNETMARVEAYLRQNYAEHITGQTLARQFGYVPSYISFLFRQTYGQSPTDYLTRLRLDRAKELIRSKPDMLIREIAQEVGFKNQYHFSRVFKKIEGLWPTEYKQ